MWFYVWESLKVSHYPAKFGGHGQCGSRDMMFLVVEGQDSTYPYLDLLLLFISKAHDMPWAHALNFIIIIIIIIILDILQGINISV